MVTSTPNQPFARSTEFATLRINEADLESKKSFISLSSPKNSVTCLFDNTDKFSISRLSRSSETSDNSSPEMYKKLSLNRDLLKRENILPNVRKFSDFATNTDEPQPKRLMRSEFMFENILPDDTKILQIKPKTRTCSTETILTMKDVYTPNDIALIVDDALKMFKESIETVKISKTTQCTPQQPIKKHQEIQVTEPFKIRSNVGVTVKPRTSDVGTEVGPGPGTRSIASGPDPVSILPISLNAMNSRSHSFNYGDTRPKKKTTKSIGLTVDGLIKTSSRSTDTCGLTPKRREFGTSPMKKIFVDVSVGDSLKPHIAISCAANYCDNCKETIKSLAKQISNNSENNYRTTEIQSTNVASRIPRPSHIGLNTPDLRKQFKRQDTYTKIPTGIIRYDADNKETYDTNNR